MQWASTFITKRTGFVMSYRVRYTNLLTSGKLNSYPANIDRQAEKLFLR